MNNLCFKNFSKIPFIYELKSTPHNDLGIPDNLPFKLTYDPKYGLIKQEYSVDVQEALVKGYKISSILGGNSTNDEIGSAYTDSILGFIRSTINYSFEGLKVLDIGCGTGFLLHKLRSLGCDVYGIEPGKQAKIGVEEYNLPIINDFFPSAQLDEDFDLVISILVLEHIVKPEQFLSDIKKLLKSSGMIILGVPNEEPYISAGDISTLFHEHWNYFTPKSFDNFLRVNGAENITISNSTYGGLLYASFSISEKTDAELNINLVENRREIQSYIEKIDHSTKKMKDFFDKYEKSKIGIYVPGRIVNFLISENLDVSNIRFFDDDENSYGKYYPGINIPVENFTDLKTAQIDVILVMSSFFGPMIKLKIAQQTDIKNDKIFIWEDFFSDLE